jgi:hypothetical protein
MSQRNIINIEVHIRQNVIEDLWTYIGSHDPERGGFLFGKYTEDTCYVEYFTYDKDARVSGAVS